MKTLKEAIEICEKYHECFPKDHNARVNLDLLHFANDLGLTFEAIYDRYYPRMNGSFMEVNQYIKLGKTYHLTNSATNYKQNGDDTLVIFDTNCGRLMFVGLDYYYVVADIWRKFTAKLKSFEPLDYDELNNKYIYSLTNGKRLIAAYPEIEKEFQEQCNIAVKHEQLRKKLEEAEKLQREIMKYNEF